jgi:predicted nucleotide-binding protein (sugar kinase/HSP70/actin superfamily)
MLKTLFDGKLSDERDVSLLFYVGKSPGSEEVIHYSSFFLFMLRPRHVAFVEAQTVQKTQPESLISNTNFMPTAKS